MPFEKGHKKYGGKKKGSQHKVTKEAREVFGKMMEGELTNVKKALAKVYEEDEARYLSILSRYFPYFLPKQTEVDISIDTEELPFNINIESRKKSGSE